MRLLNIRVNTNLDSLIEAIYQLGDNLSDVTTFAAGQIIQGIRNEIFEDMVRTLAAEAGDFPQIYTEHLVQFMKLMPITVTTEAKRMRINIGLEALGNKTDLSLGYHDQALLDKGGDWSIHIGHSGHDSQSQVQLPWKGGLS